MAIIIDFINYNLGCMSEMNIDDDYDMRYVTQDYLVQDMQCKYEMHYNRRKYIIGFAYLIYSAFGPQVTEERYVLNIYVSYLACFGKLSVPCPNKKVKGFCKIPLDSARLIALRKPSLTYFFAKVKYLGKLFISLLGKEARGFGLVLLRFRDWRTYTRGFFVRCICVTDILVYFRGLAACYFIINSYDKTPSGIICTAKSVFWRNLSRFSTRVPGPLPPFPYFSPDFVT